MSSAPAGSTLHYSGSLPVKPAPVSASRAQFVEYSFAGRPRLLHETYVRNRVWFGSFADGAELRLVAADIFAKRPQDALRVRRGHNHARYQLALRHIGKHIDEVHREFFRVMMEHHQIAKLSDQFLFVRLDLHLHLLAAALGHGSLRSVFDSTIFFPVAEHALRQEYLCAAS